MANANAPQLSESQYAQHRKELLALMSHLRSVGAQGELDLLRITVIGSQSAGNHVLSSYISDGSSISRLKSSVVEAISGIKVLRGAGTCTRCSMECQISSSTSVWPCQISIRLELDEFGRAQQEIEEYWFIDIVTSKDEVEVALRRAQFAVLNPSVPFRQILEMSLQDLKNGIPGKEPLLFSRNAVCVDLEGPDLTDLMFLDLPDNIEN
ncbi:hypothetical protein B0H19DRAFT_1261444 [Mycena capillaripes]|nr:hypothetical protein B0H19DRAFT_1261444 [Mycena capillaripes]